MNGSRLKERLLAGLLHLLLSAAIAGAVAFLIFQVWYPAPLAEAQGIGPILLLLIGVDVAIGPLLTTIVFDRRKKSLKLDLAVIAAFQFGALLYGMASIFEGRPALIVFTVDRFSAVPASAMLPEGLEKARAEGKPGLPWLHPRFMAAELPSDPKERNDLLFSGRDVSELAQYHVPYAQAARQVLEKLRPLGELKARNGLDDAGWQALMRSLPLPEADMGYLPLETKTRDGAVILDRRTAEVIRITLLHPDWSRKVAPTSSAH